MVKVTPVIVNHIFSEKSNDRKIVHNGVAYSPRAYALLVASSPDIAVIAKAR